MKNTPLLGFAFALTMPVSAAFAQDVGQSDAIPSQPQDCDYVRRNNQEQAIPLSDYSLEMFSIRTGCLLLLRDQGAVDPQTYRDTVIGFQQHIEALAQGRPGITLQDNYISPDGIIAENFVYDYSAVAYYEQFLGAFYKENDFFYDPLTDESRYLKRFSRQIEYMNPDLFNQVQSSIYERWEDINYELPPAAPDLPALKTPVNYSFKL